MTDWFVEEEDGTHRELGLEEMAEKFRDPKYKTVARDTMEGLTVSTVWLGLDHRYDGYGPPLIYETMIFLEGGKDGLGYDGYCERYSYRKDAEERHKEIVEAIIAFRSGHIVESTFRRIMYGEDEAGH